MIEEQKLLEEFLTKVDSTMKLLKIDELKAEKQKLEAEMQAPGFWDNQDSLRVEV